ncbi:transcriptional regulator [Chelonobacter oris]|uniref:Transcriptional regulator n=1 Tax=Chelonobacter oris TaxID=505317 RepID=A0A0A3ASK2_9PAST|nr:LysR family transcriptional regulator [Chelonobacter oris]KGQ70060.1 transcriptional regulator [Chelonobacter oris]
MDLNAIRLFVAVVQAGSLSKASQQLDVPIATISRQLKALEKSLNTQLFDRFKTGVKPTMLGQKLYEDVYLSVDNLLQAERALGDTQQQLSGKLRISTPSGFEPVWDWVSAFQQQHPQVEVHCLVTDRVLDLVEDGIDVAFRVGDLHTDSVIARELMPLRAKLVATPALLARLGEPREPADLAHFPCAGWATNGQKTMQWQLGGQSVTLPCRFGANDSYALAHITQKGLVIGQLPDYIAERLIRDAGLVEVLPDHPQPSHPVHLLYPAHRHASSLIQAFLGFCLASVG